MPSEDLQIIPICFFLCFFWFLCSGDFIDRHENVVRDFAYALREKYPRSYVQQNKVIKFIRKRFAMRTDRSLHWVICVLHYLQIVMAISPALVLLALLFVPPEKTVVTCLLIQLSPFGLMAIIRLAFTTLQALRCMRIKRKSPGSKWRLHDWRDRE